MLGYLSTGGGLGVLDSGSAEWRVLIPVDTVNVAASAGSPDGARVAFAGWLGPNGGVLPGGETAAPGTLVAGTIDVESRVIRLLAELPDAEPLPGLSWGTAEAIHLARWREADAMPSLWRLSEATGAQQHVGDLPAPCVPGSVMVGAGGRGAVCMVEDLRGDIWLYDVAGLRR